MKVRLILISWEENSEAVSDALVAAEDRINDLLRDLAVRQADQLNLILCAISDDEVENRAFVSSMIGRRSVAGIRTFGCGELMKRTIFSEMDAGALVRTFLANVSATLAAMSKAPFEVSELGTIRNALTSSS